MYATYEELLKKKGVKTADVCRATGLRQSMFSDWKNGRSVPKTDKLQLIADYFDVPLETFTSKKKMATFTVKTPRLHFDDAQFVNKIQDIIIDESTKLAAEILNKEYPKIQDAIIDSLLSDFEWELLACYRKADPGTRAAVRKLLDVQDEDTLPYPDPEISDDDLLPIAAHAEEGATEKDLESDVAILREHTDK